MCEVLQLFSFERENLTHLSVGVVCRLVVASLSLVACLSGKDEGSRLREEGRAMVVPEARPAGQRATVKEPGASSSDQRRGIDPSTTASPLWGTFYLELVSGGVLGAPKGCLGLILI